MKTTRAKNGFGIPVRILDTMTTGSKNVLADLRVITTRAARGSGAESRLRIRYAQGPLTQKSAMMELTPSTWKPGHYRFRIEASGFKPD